MLSSSCFTGSSHVLIALRNMRLMFYDFSSAFNTIQPQILRGKLENLGVELAFIEWISSYLTERPQYVRMGSEVSETDEQHWSSPGSCAIPFSLYPLHI